MCLLSVIIIYKTKSERCSVCKSFRVVSKALFYGDKKQNDSSSDLDISGASADDGIWICIFKIAVIGEC